MIPGLKITTEGDDGHGCYTGVRIIIELDSLCHQELDLFWKDFFAQHLAKEHDAACNKIDWNKDPIQAWRDYDYATRKFIIDCTLAANALPDLESRERALIQTSMAAKYTNTWGVLKFGLAFAGYKI